MNRKKVINILFADIIEKDLKTETNTVYEAFGKFLMKFHGVYTTRERFETMKKYLIKDIKAPLTVLKAKSNFNIHDSAQSTFLRETDTLNLGYFKQISIEIAYKRKDWGDVMFWLQKGAPFPQEFDIKLIPTTQHDLLNHISLCEEYTEIIKFGDTKKVIQGLCDNKINIMFRSLANQSAVRLAWTSTQYRMYVLLKHLGFTEFWDESPVDSVYLTSDQHHNIKSAMIWLMKYNPIKICKEYLSQSAV